MKVVYVEWLDAEMSGETMDISYLKESDGVKLFSAGMLISEDKKVVRIAQDIYEGEKRCRSSMVIPRHAITRMELWEPPDA